MASLRLGDIAPDFDQDSSRGRIRFHSWLADSWAVLFSHPADFEPVCTMIDSLQLTDNYSVATPADWRHGDDVVIVPSVQDPEVIKQKFPKGYTVGRPYLRITPLPDLTSHPSEISRSG
jgi:alkyl hydroperoxide reductase subunit AhpC